jgi:hypothetical protein
MIENSFTELFEDIEDDISMGWSELPITKKDMKKLSVTNCDDWMKFSVELGYNDRTIEITCYERNYIPGFDTVFANLISDARCVHQSSFPDFCDNYGYDNDSIKALNIFKSCKKQKKKLLYLLGEETFKLFMECEFDL